MQITQNVISDLMPAYLLGEASEDTRVLIETYLHEHPNFEWAEEPAEDLLAQLYQDESASGRERDMMMRVKRILRIRSLLFGATLFFSFMPFSVADISGRDTFWILLRDQPLLAAFFGMLAVIAWGAYFWTFRAFPDIPRP